MKHCLIIVCLLSGLPLSVKGQGTLDDCIRYAWEHNLEFKNTRIEVKEAHTDYVAALGKFLPNVSVQAEVGRHTGRSVDPGTNGYTSDSYNQGTLGLDVTLSLFEGFARINRIRFTRFVKKEKEWNRLARQNELAYKVVEAYYKTILDKELLQLAEEQLHLGEHYLRQAESFVELGLKSVSDLKEVGARHQGDVFRLSSYEKNYGMSLLYLKEILGLKGNDTLEITPWAEGSEFPAFCVEDAEELYLSSLSALPDYKRMEMQEAAARKEYAVTLGQFAPIVFAHFSWGSDCYDSFFSLRQLRSHWNKYVGIGISFPIVNGLDRYAALKKRRLNITRVRNHIEYEKQRLYSEIQQMALSLRSGWEEHRQAALQVQAETQVLKETERKWEEGLVSAFQLMEAQNRVLSARAEQTRVRLQYELTSRLAVYYRTGSFLKL